MTTKARHRLGQSRFFVVAVLLLLILVALPAAAQDGAATPIAVSSDGVESISINEIKPASVSPLAPRARFVLSVTGPTSAIVQALATTPGLAPAIQITDPSGILILSADNSANLNIVQSPVNLPSAGDYRLEFYDRGGASGDLVIAVQPGLPQLPPVGLLAGQQVDGLPDGDARDAEFGGQFLVGRQPQAQRPYPAGDPLTKNVGDLGVFRNMAVGNQIHFGVPNSRGGGRPARRSYDITRAAPRSPIIRLLALVLAEVICGMTEASITRSRSTPRTRSCGSSTDVPSLPIRQVPTQ